MADFDGGVDEAGESDSLRAQTEHIVFAHDVVNFFAGFRVGVVPLDIFEPGLGVFAVGVPNLLEDCSVEENTSGSDSANLPVLLVWDCRIFAWGGRL